MQVIRNMRYDKLHKQCDIMRHGQIRKISCMIGTDWILSHTMI